MPLRISSQSTFQRVLSGLHLNFSRLIRAQEQVSSGRRILRPSDDPTGASRVLALERRMAEAQRFLETSASGRNVLDAAAAALQSGSAVVADVRELLIKGMSGALSQSDRDLIAGEIELLRDQLLEVANSRAGDRYLFAGTATSQSPWSTALLGGIERALYSGNQDEQSAQIGSGVEVGFNVAGTEIFAKNQLSGVQYAGLTGIASGTTADQGSGYEHLTLAHEATDPGALASVGVALVGGGAGDTLLGSQTLVIDAAAGTVQLGTGAPVAIPAPGSPEAADLVVVNELGGELHLDLGAWSGADYSGSVSGSGSISIDGTTFVPLDFGATDLELVHPETGNVLHVDATGIRRAGVELAQYSGAVNLFDTLTGIAADLRSGAELGGPGMLARLDLRLGELERSHDELLTGLGTLGSRSARLSGTEQRLEGAQVALAAAVSELRDADFSEVVIDMTRAEQTLQLAQATGLRLMQNSLLNFLR